MENILNGFRNLSLKSAVIMQLLWKPKRSCVNPASEQSTCGGEEKQKSLCRILALCWDLPHPSLRPTGMRSTREPVRLILLVLFRGGLGCRGRSKVKPEHHVDNFSIRGQMLREQDPGPCAPVGMMHSCLSLNSEIWAWEEALSLEPPVMPPERCRGLQS